MLELKLIKNSDRRLRADMANHYSEPEGFVGRNLCYSVRYAGLRYGSIVAGSAIMHLIGRDEFFGLTKEEKAKSVQRIINNTFYHVEKLNGRYPCRNFTVKALALFRQQASIDWLYKYGEQIIGFESLIELPRTGEIYKRDGWVEVGTTKGFTCKRVAGKGSDSWGGKRQWDTENLRPKRVFCRLPDRYISELPTQIVIQERLFAA